MTGIVSGLGHWEATGIVSPLNSAWSGTDSEAMAGLEIIIKEFEEASPGDVRQIGIQANGEFLTKLFRYSTNREDTYLHAPPSRLAFWILDSWWRIFHEPEPPRAVTAEWLLAHEISSIGGGYAWPPVRLWSEGGQVGIRAQPQFRASPGPVRFKTDYYGLLTSANVKRGFDKFLERVVELALEDRDELLDLHRQVKSERADPEIAIWRMIEAELGFDVDEAPVELMNRLNGLMAELGLEAVSEACMSQQGNDVTRALEEALWAVENSNTKIDLSPAISAARFRADQGPDEPSPRAWMPPWKLAEQAAERLRENLGVPSGPISNKRLGNLLGVSAYRFNHLRSFTSIPYGIRRREPDQPTSTVALRAGRPEARRFQLCRVLGDAIWSANDRLGLISSAKSARQKFQRAFAQSLLCPFRDLLDFIGTNSPLPEDVTAAAHRFRVSERLVQSTLVNKGVIDRQRFEQLIATGEARGDSHGFAYA